MTPASPLRTLLKSQNWKSLLADVTLVVLISGPLAAPFLASAPLPLLQQMADTIYAVGQWVCPQPELSLVLSPPYAMAVCMRSYGTVMGLAVMRLLYSKTQGHSRYWLEQYGIWGFVITFILCLFYPFELTLQGFEGWGINNWAMTACGLVAGMGLGAYVMPIFHESRAEANLKSSSP